MSELTLQQYVVQLLRLTAVPGTIYLHIPNGEYRSKKTAARLKGMGVLPGAADLYIGPPGGKAHFLELKAARGRPSPAQVAFAALCAANGTPYAVARTPGEAQDVLAAWGAIRVPHSVARAA